MIDPAFAVNTICARFRPRITARSCTSSHATTITLAMLDLCSASCKARRFAPPARTRGLRAFDACAQIGLGNYVMVGAVMTLSWTDLGR